MTRIEIEAELNSGRCPAGDDQEDGSGLGLIVSSEGRIYSYRYDRPDSEDGFYSVYSWKSRDAVGVSA